MCYLPKCWNCSSKIYADTIYVTKKKTQKLRPKTAYYMKPTHVESVERGPKMLKTRTQAEMTPKCYWSYFFHRKF